MSVFAIKVCEQKCEMWNIIKWQYHGRVMTHTWSSVLSVIDHDIWLKMMFTYKLKMASHSFMISNIEEISESDEVRRQYIKSF